MEMLLTPSEKLFSPLVKGFRIPFMSCWGCCNCILKLTSVTHNYPNYASFGCIYVYHVCVCKHQAKMLIHGVDKINYIG